MGIYGNQINETNQEIMLEMQFSKKQLQDPKQIERILKSKNSVKNISTFLMVLSGIITVIAGIATMGVGLLILAPLLFKIYETLLALPEKTEDKNLKKLIDSCENYKNKLEKKLESDPNNTEIKDIINKLDKNIKLAKSKYTEKIEEKRRQQINEVKKVYRNLEKWLNNPYSVGDGYESDIFSLAQYAGIPESILIEKIKNSNKLRQYSILGDYFGNDENDYNSCTKKGCENFKEVKNGKLPTKCIKLDDDYALVFLPSNSKLIYVYSNNEMGVTSLYKELIKEKLFEYYNKDIIIDADKELGYYIFSKCPENIKKKEFV